MDLLGLCDVYHFFTKTVIFGWIVAVPTLRFFIPEISGSFFASDVWRSCTSGILQWRLVHEERLAPES